MARSPTGVCGPVVGPLSVISNLAIGVTSTLSATPIVSASATGEWVLRNRDEILAQLERLHHLQATVRRFDGPFVLCHTDLHGGNVLVVLVDEGGRLCLLDWDDAKVAPPEHDLWAGLGEDDRGASFDAFLDAYRRAEGAAPLHLDHFAFYLLRRHVEDMAVCLGRLLARDADAREDADLLLAMEDWGVAQWSRLDDTLAIVAAALRLDGC